MSTKTPTSPAESRQFILNRMTEDQLLAKILEFNGKLPKSRRWLITHFRPASTEKGWRTPLTGDTGFVDVAATRSLPEPQLLLLELKMEGKEPRTDQRAWLDRLGEVESIVEGALGESAVYARSPILVRIIRPSDWAWVERLLA